MKSAEYELRFRADELEARVGDKVNFAGIATIQSIKGDVIDITGIGTDPEFALGEVTIALIANRTTVEKA
jgi:hypothetical protein